MTRVTIQDVREVAFCVKGTKRFCERYGLSWTQLRREGLTAEELRATGDSMALAAVEAAEKREADNGR